MAALPFVGTLDSDDDVDQLDDETDSEDELQKVRCHKGPLTSLIVTLTDFCAIVAS